MNTIRRERDTLFPVIALAMALAMIAGIAYFLIDLDILAVGNLQPSEEPAGIIYVAAGCYLAGGLLILARRRWLWIFGAIMNGMVILFFFQMYQSRPEVLTSPGGLVTKAVQILLEVTLIYLIVSDWRNQTRRKA
jgi:hypothetical protein